MTTFTVTVVSTGGGNKYFIDGVQQASVSLIANNSFTFNQDASSNDGHPLLLSTTSDGTHNSGSRYDTYVTYIGEGSTVSASDYIYNFDSYSTRSITIEVELTTPNLFYYCNYHSGMGGSASFSNPLQGWGRQAWNDGTWGGPVPVSLTGTSLTSALGTESVVGDALVTLDSLQVSSALGTATGEATNVYPVTGVSASTTLGSVSILEGAGVLLSSLQMNFATGDDSSSGSVDAGWGRSTWGAFAWNENIEFITDVSGVSMSTSLGTTTQEVGTGVIVNATGLSMTSAAGSISGTGLAVITPTPVTISAALSGVTVSGEGSVGVVAPSDQLDFNIGTVTIDIFTQVDSPSVAMTTTLGAIGTVSDALVQPTGVSSSFAAGTAGTEVGTGVIVSVSTVALSFASGTASAVGDAPVFPTGVSISSATGSLFSTPWANVAPGVSNTWTEVDAA